jgi:anti-anti-sigma factor
MPAEVVLMIRSNNITGRALRALRSELRRLVAPGRRMTLNLAGVETIDSNAASLVLEIARALQKEGGKLRLISVSSQASAFFELLRLHRIVEMQRAEAPALTFAVAA